MPRLLSTLPLHETPQSDSLQDRLTKSSVSKVVENVVSLRDAAVAEDQIQFVPRQTSSVDESYFSCGRRLRHRRQEINADAVKIAQQLRIPVAYLDAIEAGRWEQLPGRAFAICYVRDYAKILGLDSGDLATCAKSEIAPVSADRTFRFPAPIYPSGGGWFAIILSVAVTSSVAAAVLYL